MEVFKPWVLVGDFNCVINDEERSSNSGVSSRFRNWVMEKGLLDIGFSGNPFTWSHGVSLEMRRATRLDMVSCCDEWRRMFPSSSVRYLSHSYSDHCLFLLNLNRKKSERLGERLFKFQASWLLHNQFFRWMEEQKES